MHGDALAFTKTVNVYARKALDAESFVFVFIQRSSAFINNNIYIFLNNRFAL